MTRPAEIADRHSKPIAGLGVAGRRALSVRIHAGSPSSRADQHLLVCLVNLLCRLAGTVKVIEIDAPAHRLDVALPHRLSGVGAMEALSSLAAWATVDAVPVVAAGMAACEPTDASDGVLSIAIGPRAGDGHDLYAHGAGWRARVGTTPPAPSSALATPAADSANPLGPYLAASVVAGEVFKRIRGLLRGRFADDWAHSLWNGVTAPFHTLTNGPEIEGMDLPPFHLGGAGAVGQGLIVLMGAAALQSAFPVTLDDDRHDGTNLNRCFLAGVADVRRPKVVAVHRHRGLTGLKGLEFEGTVADLATRGPAVGLPPALAEAYAADRYGLIVSAVDRNTSRWDIQGLRPAMVVGGSTDALTAKAIVYDGDPRHACLACHNPREEDGARLRRLEQEVRGMEPNGVRAHLDGRLGPAEIEDVLAYLRDAPGCGSAGARALGVAAMASPGEFAASFVSMTAATLLFARMLQLTVFASAAPVRAPMTTIALRNLNVGDDSLAVDPACPYHVGVGDRD